MSTDWTPELLREFIDGREVRFIDGNRQPTPLPAWATDAVVSSTWTGDLARVHDADRPGVTSAYKAAVFDPGTAYEATVRLRQVDHWTTLRLQYLNLLHRPDTRATVCTVEVVAQPVPIDRAVDVPWAILICDMSDTICSVDGMVEELYGYRADELVGRSLLGLVHPDDVERCVQASVALLNNPGLDQVFTHRIQRPDGTVRLVQATLNGNDRLGGTLRVSHHDAERTLHNEMLNALSEEQFTLFYQPVVELESGRVIGAEALVRWQHPSRGMVPPNEFIPYAESSNLIVDLGRWVLRAACREAATWPAGMHVAVNLSVRQLADEHIAAIVAEALLTAGLDPHRLVLEITESALIDDPEQAIRALSQLKSLGLTLAIDDFGTGYSSLAHLKRMPVDTLKIDRSFVEGLGKDDGDEAIVSSVLGLAHSFGLHVVAEGIETEDQRQHLDDLGCRLAQGYLWSRPVPAEIFRTIVAGSTGPGDVRAPGAGPAAGPVGRPHHPVVLAGTPGAPGMQQPCPTCGR
jgi:PAS domain S-box-containing protein